MLLKHAILAIHATLARLKHATLATLAVHVTLATLAILATQALLTLGLATLAALAIHATLARLKAKSQLTQTLSLTSW